MTNKTAEEVLNDFMEADKALVESFNNENEIGHVPMEGQIRFISVRLHMTGSALAAIAKKIIEEKKHNVLLTGAPLLARPVERRVMCLFAASL